MEHHMITSAQAQSPLFGEWPRIVRLCRHLTGDADAAEDLAQETLIVAWRNADRLRRDEAWQAWLSGIARNICRHWARKHGRELARSVTIDDDQTDLEYADDYDLEVELERNELATLLDKALALLPPETRAVLVQRYIEESPHAEIAARLGLSENAVAVRLHRGRLALRQLLTSDLHAEAAAYGLVAPPSDDMQPTPIWCPACGEDRLIGWLHPDTGAFMLRCPHCCAEPGLYTCRHDHHPALLRGIKGFKVAYRRAMIWGHDYYGRALGSLTSGLVPCWKCDRSAPLLLHIPHDDAIPSSLWGSRGVHILCPACGGRSYSAPRALILQQPEARRFWQAHPRMRWLHEREIVLQGRPAMLAGFESVDLSARLEIVYARDTYAPLLVNGAAYV